ncbi:MAG TPA: PAS domain-containing sensor histidine kinase [Burkholderiaceae bacterium]|nr:PAS domain-containing sensor histidine kinase [Burkholderiaceae bacterium]
MLLEPAALYDEAACGLMVTADDGLIQHVNQTFCRWTGHEPSGLVGHKKLQDLLTMGGRIFHQTHWAPLLHIQGSVAEVKLEVVHRDGHKLPMVLNAVRRERASGVTHEIALFLAEDRHKYEHELMLARKQAEELLASERATQQALSMAQEERDRQRMLAQDRALFAEQMIGIVSHDLRNPLSVIRMSAHLLALGDLSASQISALGRLSNSVSRADRLIVDLLDFTQARLGGGLKIRLKPLDLHTLVAECLEDLRVAFPQRQLVHRTGGSGDCMASADRLVQLIGNLVSNAVTYGSQDTPVTVSSTIAPETFQIVVHNHGAPVPEALLSNMFNPMVCGSTPGSGGQGVGLGLFIVREIVHAHGGTVEVSSSASEGTTFMATLPCAQN